jgi:hypothetical protein
MKSTFGALAITLGIFLFTGAPANAEWYVAGQVGFVKNSLGYGGKVGYFSPDYLDWLGLEFEVFTSNPHIKQQHVTAGFGGTGSLDGSHLRIITPAVNVMFRVPG